jgi:hypothetical protein
MRSATSISRPTSSIDGSGASEHTEGADDVANVLLLLERRKRWIRLLPDKIDEVMQQVDGFVGRKVNLLLRRRYGLPEHISIICTLRLTRSVSCAKS